MEKPILFNTDMVRAILDGQKTMTRRIVKPQPPKGYDSLLGVCTDSTERKNIGKAAWELGHGGLHHYAKPPYQVGDVLWVRETWCKLWDLDGNDQIIEGTDNYYYAADGYNPTPYNAFPDENGFTRDRDCPRWRPSIHMPRKAARIFLKVTDVRAERLQEITEKDSQKEGCMSGMIAGPCTSRGQFRDLWDLIYYEQGHGWDVNPWVWVISFERVDHA